MNKTKFLALLLTLCLLASAVLPGTFALPVKAASESKGMEIKKEATDNKDGTYTITLEAYATGEKISTEVTREVPTDIILVLDQSGSMDYDMTASPSTTYWPYDGSYLHSKSNSNLYDYRHNDNGNQGNLYYLLRSGSYATVSVVRTQGEGSLNFQPCPSEWQNDAQATWDDRDPADYWKYSNNLYVKVDEEYKNVTLTRKGTIYEIPVLGSVEAAPYTYTYAFPDGSTFVSKDDTTSPGDFNGMGPLYIRNAVAGEYTYTYTCTDENGKTIDIGTSTGADTNFEDAILYYRNETAGGTIKRVNALKDATRNFVNSVNRKAAGQDGQLGTDDDINHRVAVVGFASESSYGNNTELLSISGSNSGNVGIAYNSIQQQNYVDVLQDMDTTSGQEMVTRAINALATNGATQADLGLEMAKEILDANSVPEGEQRNRVVVFFTDGQPTSSNSFETEVANNAIAQANSIKNAGADVYSIGIFDGADATSAGIAYGHSQRKENKYMQDVSSNNGTPQTPSYYLSASDSSTLNNIFEQISDNIQTGGSNVTLDSKTVIKDIISPQFTLPKGATADDITLETYSYTGENQWSKNSHALGAHATVNGDQVSVTGFNFKENWCGTDTTNGNTVYRGNKLVISFNVQVKEGFLGGNGVYTNTNAGVYENADARDPVFTFDRPQVDVEIGKVTVTAEDKNVYLLGGLTADQIKSGVTVTAGNNINIDLSKANDPDKPYDLEPWQTEYVDITFTYKDAAGSEVTNLDNLTQDTTYTVSVKVTPKTTGTATEKTGTSNGNINVFKPVLTFNDREVYYGDTLANSYYDSSMDLDYQWKHENEVYNSFSDVAKEHILGDEPSFHPEYYYAGTETLIKKTDAVNTKEDIPVKAKVYIGYGTDTTDITGNVFFRHGTCTTPDCGWNETELDGNPGFLLHVNTCTLTIKKNGGDSSEPYVFDVLKDGVKYSEVTVMGDSSETIMELPVGVYTIQEKTNWSWRYNASYGDPASLTAQNHTGTVTCTNSKTNNYWLNGFSNVVKNISGVNH